MPRPTLLQEFKDNWKLALKRRKKLVAYVTTVAGEAVAFGLLTGGAREWVMFALALLGGGGIHQTENAPPARTE